MKVIVVKDYQAMSDLAAEIIANTIKTNPSCTLGLATGSSPIGTYQNLVKDVKAGEISFKDVKTYNLDEQETFIVKLTDKTRQDNKRFFNSIDEVPTHAITMGIKNIMQAKRILMLISGVNKADTVVKLLSGNITTDFPASVLNNHPDVTVIIDQDAYSKM